MKPNSVIFQVFLRLFVRARCVFLNRKSYGAVRSFHVSFGAVRCGYQIQQVSRCGPVRFSNIANLTVRFPVEWFLLRCGANPRRENRINAFFPTLHRMSKPCETAVPCGSLVVVFSFSRYPTKFVSFFFIFTGLYVHGKYDLRFFLARCSPAAERFLSHFRPAGQASMPWVHYEACLDLGRA